MDCVVFIIRCQLKDVSCAARIILAIKKQGASTLCYYVHIYSMSEEIIMTIIEESSFTYEAFYKNDDCRAIAL